MRYTQEMEAGELSAGPYDPSPSSSSANGGEPRILPVGGAVTGGESPPSGYEERDQAWNDVGPFVEGFAQLRPVRERLFTGWAIERGLKVLTRA